MQNNVCSKCGKAINNNKSFVIDEKPLCFHCLYGDTEPFEIYPIGKVTTELQQNEVKDISAGRGKISRIDLLPSQKRFLYRLEDEPHILIVYYLHKVKSMSTLFHRRLDGKKVGVFASRTQNRLSRIAIQDVKLLKVESATLYVEGLDAIDGSPVLDIKLGLKKQNSIK